MAQRRQMCVNRQILHELRKEGKKETVCWWVSELNNQGNEQLKEEVKYEE
jgi:hypothetical protein